MKKLILLVLVCLAMIPSAFAADIIAVNQFEDVSDDAWYIEELMHMAELDAVPCTSDTEFGPDDFITRAEFAEVFWRVFGSRGSREPTHFEDVSEGA